jgi:hypothetical protein
MKKFTPVVGALAVGIVASPASASVQATSVAPSRPTIDRIIPSDAAAKLIEEKTLAVKQMRVAFGEQFPDKFAEKGAFSNFHRDFLKKNYGRPDYRNTPALPQQRYQKMELDHFDVQAAFQKFKPS